MVQISFLTGCTDEQAKFTPQGVNAEFVFALREN